MQISVLGHLLMRAAKENWGGPVHSPLGRHHHKTGKHTNKTKQQNLNKPKPDTQE